MKIAAASLLALSALTTACVNSSALQTAKAMDPGKQRFLVGGGYYASPDLDKDASSATGEDTSLKLPYMELGYRRGLVDKVEAGVKYTLPGTAAIDGKYQFLDAGGFALAAGASVGYFKLSSEAGDSSSSTTVVDTIVPVYASYDIAKALAVYTSPKYVMRYAKSESMDAMMSESSSGLSHLVGATLGTRLGNRFGLFLETTYLKSITNDFDAFQVNGSFFF